MAKPKLRFPEFTDEWEEIRLKEVVNKVGSGKTPKGGATVYQNKGIMLLRSQNVQNGFLDLEDVVYISEEINQTMKNSNVKTGDLLFNITGASIGRCCIYLLTYEANVNQHVCIIRLIPNENVHFYMQYILTRQIQNQIPMLQTGGGREGLNFESVKAIKLYRPNFNEQKKLAEFLSSVDNVIQIHEQEITALEEQKKGVMQKLFNQEVRFKADDGSKYPEWKERKLNDILIERNQPQKISADAPLLAFTIKEGVINPEDKKSNKRDFLIKDKENKKFLLTEYNDIIYNPANLKFGAIHRNKLGRGVVSPIYAIFYTNEYPTFIEYVVTDSNFIKRSLKYLEGTVIKLMTLKPKDFLLMKIKLPSKKEQQKIADCLSAYDESIQIKKEKLEIWKDIKKGLLQQMFV